MVEQDAIPDISDCSTGEILTVILILIALFSAFSPSVSNYTDAIITIPITLGLAAIALAILSVGRHIRR